MSDSWNSQDMQSPDISVSAAKKVWSQRHQFMSTVITLFLNLAERENRHIDVAWQKCLCLDVSRWIHQSYCGFSARGTEHTNISNSTSGMDSMCYLKSRRQLRLLCFKLCMIILRSAYIPGFSFYSVWVAIISNNWMGQFTIYGQAQIPMVKKG